MMRSTEELRVNDVIARHCGSVPDADAGGGATATSTARLSVVVLALRAALIRGDADRRQGCC